MNKGLLIIVTTSLQLINAIELTKHLGHKKVSLLVFDIANRGDGIVRYATEEHGCLFRSIERISLARTSFKRNPYRFLSEVYFIRKSLRPYRLYESFILGHSNMAVFLMSYIVKQKKEGVYIVDDGVKTLRFFQDASYYKKSVDLGSPKIRDLRNWFFGLVFGGNGKFQKTAVYFTQFYGYSKNSALSSIENSYTSFKKKYIRNTKLDSQSIHIIGQPIYDGSYLTRSVYLELLERVGACFPGYDIQYCPHPLEDRENIEGELKGLGYSTFNTNLPYELAYSRLKRKPKYIFTFFSAIIPLISEVAHEKTKIYLFDILDLLNDSESGLAAALEDLYIYFSEKAKVRRINASKFLLLPVKLQS